MIPLLIVAAVLLLLMLLLLAPLKLDVTFQERFSVQVRFLFFRFPLTQNEEPEQEEQPAGKAPKDPKDSSDPGLAVKLKGLLHREGLRGFLQSLREVAQSVESASKKILKKVRLNKFDLYIWLAGKNDAAEAAILYGQVCGAVYTASGILFGVFPCRKKSVTVDLDYQNEEHQIEFSGTASIRMLYLLVEGLILLYRVLPFFKKLQTIKDQKERISQARKQDETK